MIENWMENLMMMGIRTGEGNSMRNGIGINKRTWMRNGIRLGIVNEIWDWRFEVGIFLNWTNHMDGGLYKECDQQLDLTFLDYSSLDIFYFDVKDEILNIYTKLC